MKINNQKIVICIISIIFIGLLIYLPNNIHFKALCGDSDALVEIGDKLIQSENKNDQKKGYELLLKAANKGNPEAMYLVGWCNSYGKGTEQSNLAGYNYFIRAYDLKSKISSGYKYVLIRLIGECHLYGKGTFQDIDKAIDFLKESAKKGDVYAVRQLAIAYGFLALGIYERKEKEEVIFFPDFYASGWGVINRAYQEKKSEYYNQELNEEEKKYISYGIKAYAYSILYSQIETDFDLKKSLESSKKDIPTANLYRTTYDYGLDLTPARHARAEIYAKEFLQSIKSD
jgi:TPR repeat protein